jgi:hypothetical protein
VDREAAILAAAEAAAEVEAVTGLARTGVTSGSDRDGVTVDREETSLIRDRTGVRAGDCEGNADGNDIRCGVEAADEGRPKEGPSKF